MKVRISVGRAEHGTDTWSGRIWKGMASMNGINPTARRADAIRPSATHLRTTRPLFRPLTRSPVLPRLLARPSARAAVVGKMLVALRMSIRRRTHNDSKETSARLLRPSSVGQIWGAPSRCQPVRPPSAAIRPSVRPIVCPPTRPFSRPPPVVSTIVMRSPNSDVVSHRTSGANSRVGAARIQSLNNEDNTSNCMHLLPC